MKLTTKKLLSSAALFLVLLLLNGCGKEESPFSPLIPDAPDFSSVYDGAGVFSSRTKADFDAKNDALFALTGAEIAVITVETTGELSAGDFARQAFNKWGVGSAERMNGVLLLLIPAEEDYYLQTGSGMNVILPPEALRALTRTYLEPDFAAGQYAAGAEALFEALLSNLEKTYSVDVDTWTGAPGTFTSAGTPVIEEETGGSALTVVLILLAVFVLVLLLFLFRIYRPFGRRHRRTPFATRTHRGHKVSVHRIQNGPRRL